MALSRERVALLILLVTNGCADRDPLTGTWAFSMDPDFRGNRGTVECTINQQRSSIRVRCGTGIEMPGELSGGTITFATPPMTKDRLVAAYTARLNEEKNAFHGDWTLTGGVLNERGRFAATKK